MSDWRCPECGGGFPEPSVDTDRYGRSDGDQCPWCGRGIGPDTDE